jgi:hypothetical protein
MYVQFYDWKLILQYLTKKIVILDMQAVHVFQLAVTVSIGYFAK